MTFSINNIGITLAHSLGIILTFNLIELSCTLSSL